MIMHIFCDEAGFTGNNLLDADQDIFAYAAIAVTPDVARERVTRAIQDFRLQGKELKGSRLVRTSIGQRAITRLLNESIGEFRTTAHLKPYALAGKLFEYIFEPPLANQNSFFYGLEFHKFISTLLFVNFRTKNVPTEKLLADFANFVRSGDETTLTEIFPTTMGVDYLSNPLQAIRAFAMLHRKTISDEILNFREPGVPNWILDLTTTSFYGLMCYWGERFDSLEVMCDDSKPLQSAVSFFDVMVGRTDRLTINAFGKKQPFSFNLKAPILLARSHEHPGLQLADVMAAATATVLRNRYRNLPNDPEVKKWEGIVWDSLTDNNIWPDYGILDWNDPRCFVNTLILNELIERSLRGFSLFQGMSEFAFAAGQNHEAFLDYLNNTNQHEV
jgi:hypothetical protein